MSRGNTSVYTQCGLRIRSEVDLPLPRYDGQEYDVDVFWGDDVSDTDQPPAGTQIAVFETEGGPPWYTAARAADGLVLRFRECGEFRFSAELDRVSIHADRRGRHDLLPVLLAGTAASFLLTMRGATVLHASAVEIEGRALAFVGESGRGKTTMASLMCLDGAALVTDDVLVVETDPSIRCLGGAAELRLREKAAEGIRDLPDVKIRETNDDRLAYRPASHVADALPIGAVVVPTPSHEHENVEIRRLDPAIALFTILAVPRIHGWTEPSVLERDLATIGQLVNEIPVYEAVIPWGPPFSPDIAREMRSLLAGS